MLAWTIYISFLGALALLLLPSRSAALVRILALVTTLGTFAITLTAFLQHRSGEMFTVVDYPWISSMGIHFSLKADGISLTLLLLTGVIGVCGVLFSWNIDHRIKEFFAFYLILIGAVYGVFLSFDLFLLFVFYEIVVIPKYFLIAIWGSTRREYAAMKLVLYSFIGSAMVLVGLIAAYVVSGSRSMSLGDLAGYHYSPHFQMWAFPLVFVGFGILAGLWPFHTWAPTGHVAAPTAASMLLAGVVMKLGAYGCLRVAMTMFPLGLDPWGFHVLGLGSWRDVFAVLAVIGILYGALVALVQKDFKFVIGYSSISHMGFILLGLMTLNQIGLSGAVVQMVSHGILAGLLFGVVGRMVYSRTHTCLLRRVQPRPPHLRRQNPYLPFLAGRARPLRPHARRRIRRRTPRLHSPHGAGQGSSPPHRRTRLPQAKPFDGPYRRLGALLRKPLLAPQRASPVGRTRKQPRVKPWVSLPKNAVRPVGALRNFLIALFSNHGSHPQFSSQLLNPPVYFARVKQTSVSFPLTTQCVRMLTSLPPLWAPGNDERDGKPHPARRSACLSSVDAFSYFELRSGHHPAHHPGTHGAHHRSRSLDAAHAGRSQAGALLRHRRRRRAGIAARNPRQSRRGHRRLGRRTRRDAHHPRVGAGSALSEDPSVNQNIDDNRPDSLKKVRSVIAIPLRGRKGTHGVIEIFNPRADGLTDYAIAFLHILADHAAIAIENAHDVASIQQLSITDDCTGLYNTRHLYNVLGRELERCADDGLPVSLAFLDLDSFKLVNDLHGHLVGSELLAHTGRRLQELSGPRNPCFRYGGDEFVILMPETGVQAARAHSTRILTELMETRFQVRSGLKLSVSASVGLATAPADGITVHAIIRSADTRMYLAKSNGRGHVRSA